MKRMKKLASLLLALVMTMAMAMPAFAAGPYTITVENAVDGQTYTAYKIFDVTVDEDKNSFSYTIDNASKWFGIVNTYASGTDKGLTLTEIVASGKYNVTFTNDFDAADFAAELNNNASGKTEATYGTASSDSVDLTVTDSGYYFVDTSTGALCALGIAYGDTAVTIYEKNSLPTINKKVQEDSDDSWSTSATADIGQTVNFELTVKTGTNSYAPTGSTGVDDDYVITDTMNRMTYTGNTYASGDSMVTSGSESTVTVQVSHNNEEGATVAWTLGTDFYVKSVKDDGTGVDTLTITLSKTKLASVAQNTDITITYGAKLDLGATIAGDGNKNTVVLKYGTYETAEASATVHTYKVDVFKFYKTTDAGTKNLLSGAEFTLSTKSGDSYTPLTFDDLGNGTYRYVQGTNGPVTTITTGATGKFSIQGLDAGTYYLEETEAPEGFNKLAKRIEITVSEDGTVTYKDEEASGAGSELIDGFIEVENKTGAKLPSTGGIGTTIFYIIGSILVVGAGVLLIVRRRMSSDRD